MVRPLIEGSNFIGRQNTNYRLELLPKQLGTIQISREGSQIYQFLKVADILKLDLSQETLDQIKAFKLDGKPTLFCLNIVL